MPATTLFVIKKEYRFLNNSVINELKTSYTKVLVINTAFSVKDSLHNQAVIKEMITALEDTVKIMEKKVRDIKRKKEVKNNI